VLSLDEFWLNTAKTAVGTPALGLSNLAAKSALSHAHGFFRRRTSARAGGLVFLPRRAAAMYWTVDNST